MDRLIHDLLHREFGDADLDGDVDITDFNTLVHGFDPLAHNQHNGWARGNFDGDDDIDIADFNLIALNFAPLGDASPEGRGASLQANNSVSSPASNEAFGPIPTSLTRAVVERVRVRSLENAQLDPTAVGRAGAVDGRPAPLSAPNSNNDVSGAFASEFLTASHRSRRQPARHEIAEADLVDDIFSDNSDDSTDVDDDLDVSWDPDGWHWHLASAS